MKKLIIIGSGLVGLIIGTLFMDVLQERSEPGRNAIETHAPAFSSPTLQPTDQQHMRKKKRKKADDE